MKYIKKAYIEGIYADTPANRKLGRVGMSYKEYNEKQEEKKYYYVNIPNGDSFILTSSAVSKKKIIELAIKYAEDMIEYNNYKEFKFNIEEDTEDWSENDLNNKKWDWLEVKATKYNNKIEVSIFDWNEGKYLRNDEQKRKKGELNKKLKDIEDKNKKEFQEKFGWMEELVEYKKQQNNNFEIQNDDNVLNIKLKDDNEEEIGKIQCVKDDDSKTYYFEEIIINKNFRGKGFGKKLMEKFLEEAKKDKSYKKIVLQVEAEDSHKFSNINEPEKIKELNHNLVKKFYSKFGFNYQLEEDKKELSPILELKLK